MRCCTPEPTGVAAVTTEPQPAIEIARPPRFDLGDKVRARLPVRNDGTYPGRRIGEFLIEAGEVGYVASIGEFLQRYYIYGVDFFTRGRIVGMREHEIEDIEESMKITLAKRGAVHTVYVAKKDLEVPVVQQKRAALWGGWIELANGWRLELPDLPEDTRLPLTVEARKLATAE
jgi:probable nitrogen fixation protein FixT